MIDLVDFKAKLAALIAAEDSTAVVLFGRSHLSRKDIQGPGTANRVVVAPGRPEDGDWGRIFVGNKIHPITTPSEVTHAETVTLDVWAYDGTAASNEGAQYKAMRALWQCVTRNVGLLLRKERHPTDSWYASKPRLLDGPSERRHGERVQVVFEIDFAVRAPTPAQLHVAEAAPPQAEVED